MDTQQSDKTGESGEAKGSISSSGSPCSLHKSKFRLIQVHDYSHNEEGSEQNFVTGKDEMRPSETEVSVSETSGSEQESDVAAEGVRTCGGTASDNPVEDTVSSSPMDSAVAAPLSTCGSDGNQAVGCRQGTSDSKQDSQARPSMPQSTCDTSAGNTDMGTRTKSDALADAIGKFLATEEGASGLGGSSMGAEKESVGDSHAATKAESSDAKDSTSEIAATKADLREEEDGTNEVAMLTEKEMSEVRMDASWTTGPSGGEASMDIGTENEWPRDYDFSQEPFLIAQASAEFSQREDNFLKGCKWSPDGLCILTNSEDQTLRLFNLPDGALRQAEGKGGDDSHSGQQRELESVLRIQEGELVYDYCWYPKMDSYLPETCCFASTSRDHPVHLWDAFTGKLRATYKSVDAVDELATPHSLGFSLNGRRLYCGFNKTIRVFYTDRPGKDCEVIATKKKNSTGQTGIISCFSMAPELKLYAAGSYSKTVGLYSADSNKLMCLLQGHTGGVTHLVFSPDRNRLYSGGRKDQEILCWDVRQTGRVLYTALREVSTNQRVYFDLDREGRYLVSGNQNGTVTVWDTSQPPAAPLDSNETDPLLLPCYKFKAHGDCVNGISLHPDYPVMATSSGQRMVRCPVTLMSGSSDDDSDDDQRMDVVTVNDHSLKLWSLNQGRIDR